MIALYGYYKSFYEQAKLKFNPFNIFVVLFFSGLLFIVKWQIIDKHDAPYKNKTILT
jgi:hypothetical protein